MIIIIIPAKGEHVLHMETRRFPGWLMMSGPAMKQDEWIFGPHLLDVAPTILAAMNIALPHELPGRPLLEALRYAP